MARIVVICHDEEFGDDRVTTFFRGRNVEPQFVMPFKGETLGDVDDGVVGTVVHGGRFNVFDDDKHPFLKDEKKWVDQCLKRNVPTLGICLGSQIVANVLGAAVGPLPAEPGEFGYYELTATEAGKEYFPDRLHVTESHWHQFDVPRGADLLAGSQLFPNQAFRYGRQAFAFQFHSEVTPTIFRRWQRENKNYDRPGAQPREEQDRLMAIHDRAQHAWFMGFLDRLFGPGLDAENA
ncbi:glutamine amidotransferase [Mesorhizobium sp. M0601]|uniref:glutamine amidotransferase-related protein n=1 Tax=Mesorhizobium sp. M0601 TaxID=2956969 RepID=UPI00333B5FA6